MKGTWYIISLKFLRVCLSRYASQLDISTPPALNTQGMAAKGYCERTVSEYLQMLNSSFLLFHLQISSFISQPSPSTRPLSPLPDLLFPVHPPLLPQPSPSHPHRPSSLLTSPYLVAPLPYHRSWKYVSVCYCQLVRPNLKKTHPLKNDPR